MPRNIPTPTRGSHLPRTASKAGPLVMTLSPSLRCQRLYSEWYLHEKPDTSEKKLARLRENNRSSSIKYTPSNKYPCSYCAETVAAAKLYALKHGTLTPILSKDKDEIKASGCDGGHRLETVDEREAAGWEDSAWYIKTT